MQPAAHITVIGAGFGALSAVREIRQRDPDAHITLVAPRAELHYLPGIIWIPSGLRTREQLIVPLAPFFQRMGVRHVAAEVTGLQDGGRTVLTSAGALPNDALLIATGGRFIKKLPGIEHAITPCEGIAAAEQIRDRLRAALPHILLMDAVGSSEGGQQMSTVLGDDSTHSAVFTPQADTTIVAGDFSRILQPGDDEDTGWLARRDLIPLGYLGDADKTARTFPTIDGVCWSVPGDKARYLPDGRIELLGRDSVTINSGGEKIFAEEVERAVASHPAIYDVVVVGRPSERWGSEVVAVVQLAEGAEATDDELAEVCGTHIARYKVPKAFVRTEKVMRSPAGKADYRWAKEVAAATD